MRTTFDHEKLTVYREAIGFVVWAEGILETLPKNLAVHGQLDRASTSIPLNIAEGNGKYTGPDRCRFFDIARGSALECAACLDVLVAKSGEALALIASAPARRNPNAKRPVLRRGVLRFGSGIPTGSEPGS